MLGHGQFEGFAEKYGMEFRRASMQETADEWLVARHEREIVPLLHRRADFAEARDFLLYDVVADGGGVDEHVFAYSNGSGPSRSLVVFHNRYAETAGWIRDSVAYASKDGDGSKRLVRRTLAEGLGLADGSPDDRWVVFREQRTSLEYLRPVAEIRERGLHVALRAYETRVFWELRELYDTSGVWRRLAERLGGRGVPSLEGALRELQLAPVHDALRAVIDDPSRPTVQRFVAAVAETTGTDGDVEATVDRISASARTSLPVVESIADPSQEAALRLWALLAPLGSLATDAGVGPTSQAWYEELRLGPVIADALRARGLDEAASWWAAERVRVLVDLPLASSIAGDADDIAARLVEAWLERRAIRGFLRVNAWDGTEWFHRESWAELVAWHDRMERISTPAEERAVRPVERSVIARRLLAAADESGYRVDGLHAALAGGAVAAASSAPRLPRATGLPRGPLDAPGGPEPDVVGALPRGAEPDDVTPADWAADAGRTDAGRTDAGRTDEADEPR
jgi:hypothetical protein